MKALLAVLAMGLCVVAGFAPTSGQAQGLFSPVLRVNDKAITRYELNQRQRLLQALGTPGDLAAEARARLIEERLQLEAAESLGLSASPEDIEAGVAEFAERANVTPDAFLSTLRQAGVEPGSFRDFVEANILWREVVRSRFGPRAQISEEEVDRAVALAGRSGGARVLLAEIILPARTPEEAASAQALAEDFSRLRSSSAFAQAARDFSASQSRATGGRIDWLPLNAVPASLRNTLLTMAPGAITEPVRLPNAIAVFQLRALEETPPTRPETLAIEYAELLIPSGSMSDALEIAANVDTCDDLYGVAKDLPEDRLLRETRALGEIPADVAQELARLDADEYSVALTRGNARVFLMLCGRTTELSEGIDRGDIRRQLLNQRLGSYASGYLAELRADATIIEVQ